MNHIDKQVDLKRDFPPSSAEEWKEAAEKLLKGAPYDKIMRTKTYEGLLLEPIYTTEDIKNLDHVYTMPGQAPFVRGTNAGGYLTKPWKVAQQISESDPVAFNKALREGLQNGQDTINIRVNTANGIQIRVLDDLDTAFDQVDLTKYALMIDPGEDGLYIMTLLFALCKKRGIDATTLSGSILNDPIKSLVESGQLSRSFDSAFKQMAICTNRAAESSPNLRTIAVNAGIYQEAGSSAVQELAWAMATGVEYIRQMSEHNISIDSAASRIQFIFGLGSNFFMEISKLRAARLLWSQVVAAFGGTEESQKIKIHGRTGQLNKTFFDPYVNMLRTSTEAFSAVMGGVDSLQVEPFDKGIQSSNDFSRRVARNTHTILREECHFDRVIDPAGGSWYIEKLTNDIAENAWALFQKIEENGGMIKAVLEGAIQEQAETTLKNREKNSASRKDRIVGANMYPNLQEKPLNGSKPVGKSLKNSAPPDRILTTKIAEHLKNSEDIIETLIVHSDNASIDELKAAYERKTDQLPKSKKLTIRRIAEQFELLRRAVESSGKPPKIFLANMGPVSQHKARADFSAGFFQTAGFVIDYSSGFETAGNAADAAIESGAAITVLCSTDDTYPDLVPEFVKTVKQSKTDMIFILAGYPKDHVESFRKIGIEEFIHIKANTYDILAGLLRRLEVI